MAVLSSHSITVIEQVSNLRTYLRWVLIFVSSNHRYNIVSVINDYILSRRLKHRVRDDVPIATLGFLVRSD